MSESATWPTRVEMDQFMREHAVKSSQQHGADARILFVELRGNEHTKHFLVVVCKDGKGLWETSEVAFWILHVTQQSMRQQFSSVAARSQKKLVDREFWVSQLRFGCSNIGVDPAAIDVLLEEEA